MIDNLSIPHLIVRHAIKADCIQQGNTGALLCADDTLAATHLREVMIVRTTPDAALDVVLFRGETFQ